jgi:hypothetical protein
MRRGDFGGKGSPPNHRVSGRGSLRQRSWPEASAIRNLKNAGFKVKKTTQTRTTGKNDVVLGQALLAFCSRSADHPTAGPAFIRSSFWAHP